MHKPSSQPEVRIAVVIVSYNSRDDLPRLLDSLAERDAQPIIVVDNASTDGSATLVRERYPHVELLQQSENHGFAGGNNVGYAHLRARRPDVPYVALLNPDTLVEPGALAVMADYLDEHPRVACVQPKILMHPDAQRINTAGNWSHYLGFGGVTGCDEPDDGRFDEPRAIDFASGAAMMLRTAAVEPVGLFDEAFFMYLEDAELSWKLRLAGHDVMYMPAARVQHRYTFAADFRFYQHLERNRLWLLLVYYRLPTLLLLAPAIIVMELAQLVFAISKGVLPARLRAWGYYWKPSTWRRLCRTRRAAQRRRSIGDRAFTAGFHGRLDFPQLRGPLVRYVASPIFAAYWWCVRRVMFW